MEMEFLFSQKLANLAQKEKLKLQVSKMKEEVRPSGTVD